jgi:amino acid adenylation domain-containing protein
MKAESEYSAAKRKLLETYLRGEVRIPPHSAQIARRSPEARVPLSYAQERVWLHSQLAPDLPVYNEPVTIHHSGPLDAAALERSFNEILRRHEAWRTSFRVIDGHAFQQVSDRLTVSLPVIDLRSLPRDQRDTTALAIATADAKVPIDLSELPLFRARLIRLDDEEHRLYLTLSHIIFDGVALYRVFLPELTALYKEYAGGKPSLLPELEIQHPDYACWERQMLTLEALAKGMQYWRDKLSENLPELYLPVDRPAPRRQTFRGSMLPFRFDPSLTTAVRNYCHAEAISLFPALLAGFAALLFRYSGEEHIPIGNVTAGRHLPETQTMLGYFLNTVVYPADLSGDPAFSELVRRARTWTIEALDHDRVPFEHLVRELKVQRDPGRHPIFQALFSLEPPMPQVDPEWRLTQMDVDTGTTKYDLYLELDERKDEVLGRFHYSTDLFDVETIRRIAAHWQVLIGAALLNPKLRLSELPLLNVEEKQDIVVAWNETTRDYPPTCIHKLFELQADRSPDSVAVATQGATLTYRELNQHANRLAHYLIQRGVGAEDLVGLSLNRDLDMAVALVAVLKAGAAYLPLDPRLPNERLAFMLDDAKPRLVLTQRSLVRDVFGDIGVLLDEERVSISQLSAENPEAGDSAPSLAYVMYTSGSTGKPKGVAVEHRSVVNLLYSMLREPGVNSDDRLLAVTPLSFDIAGLEIWMPLISGARVVIASSEEAADGIRLKELIEQESISFMQATPATWRLLIEAGWQGSAEMKILCGGEKLPFDLAKELKTRCGCLWNVYGPTETTIWSTIHRVSGKEESSVPIGRPIANTSVYVLDAHLNPVPPNVAGQIYIGGDGLARGYLNRPQLNADSFVANWLSSEHSPRLYRTGDLGRFRANGELEYLGRVDQQVKLRGQRIELGEIEAVLAAHAAVRQAVVVVTGEGEHQKLTAYVAIKDSTTAPTAGDLRQHIRAQLPEGMVPSSYRQIKEIPLLPSGKVNRAGVARTAATPLSEKEQIASARNETEAKLVEIWRELLKIEQVGIEENFFELGGHSLLVLQATARIRKVFAVELPVRTLFEVPTIAGLAVEIERARALGLKARTTTLQRNPLSSDPAAREALLSQLEKLTADDAGNLLRDLLDQKKYHSSG